MPVGKGRHWYYIGYTAIEQCEWETIENGYSN